MFHAYGARMRSDCLSRQVGAALLNSGGSLIATGTNEVPDWRRCLPNGRLTLARAMIPTRQMTSAVSFTTNTAATPGSKTTS